MALTAIQKDLCSRVGDAYTGPEPCRVDEHSARLHAAMELGDVAEAKDMSAMVIGKLAATLSEDDLHLVRWRWMKAFYG